ncbi:MAG: AraC family transcriptional regulator [Clostridiaceae bacterium]|nr:AraC family transcriptional regulator [Clostridiaceae bacterium]
MIYSSAVIKEFDTYTGNYENVYPYFINSCGYIKFHSKNVSIRRARVDYYLIYLVNGAGYYKINGKLQTAEGGSIVIYQPREVQDYYYLGSDNTELYWIHFTGNSVAQLLESLELTNGNIFHVGIKTELIQLFENIISEIHIKNPRFHTACIGYFIKLLSVISRELYARKESVKPLKKSDIGQCIIKMQMEYQNDHPVSYYANIANLSVSRFIRKFKDTMNISPIKYIEKIRMDKSKELLTDTDLTIYEISEIVGYNDPFYFSKVFKRNTGLSPTAFRKLRQG